MAPILSQDVSEEVVTRILSDVKIPEYRPSEKVSTFTDLVFDFTFVRVCFIYLFSFLIMNINLLLSLSV